MDWMKLISAVLVTAMLFAAIIGVVAILVGIWTLFTISTLISIITGLAIGLFVSIVAFIYHNWS